MTNLGALLLLPFHREDPADYTEAEIKAGALDRSIIGTIMLVLLWPLYALVATVLFALFGVIAAYDKITK